MKPMRVSELSRRAGVSIRALHYYEEVGLLAPRRTASGHRRYDKAAVERLQQIRSLRQLGFSLAQIEALLGRSDVTPRRIVADHLAEIQQRRAALSRLESRLKRLERLLRAESTDDTEAVEVLLQTMEAMTMYEKHLTPEQRQQVEAAHETAGDAADKWQAALDALRVEMDAGTDPADPAVKAIAERWHEAAAAFMPGDDEALHQSVMQLLHDEPQARADHGLDDALFAYLGRVLAPDEHTDA